MRKVRGAREGFTLIELLVVIAIIAILAAILFPIFAAAKRSGINAKCSSNLKQIGAAFNLYADDNGGRLPSGHRPKGYHAPSWDLVNQLNRYINTRTAINVRNPSDPNTVYTRPAVWMCPAYPITTVDAETYQFMDGFGYWMYNLYHCNCSRVDERMDHYWGRVIGEAAAVWNQELRKGPNDRLGGIRKPGVSGAPLMHCGVVWNRPDDGTVRAPHAGRMNVLYLDSHVGSIKCDTSTW